VCNCKVEDTSSVLPANYVVIKFGSTDAFITQNSKHKLAEFCNVLDNVIV